MTNIGFAFESYLSLRKVFFDDNNFNLHDIEPLQLGLFDPEMGRMEDIYKPGRFSDEYGNVYDDTIFKGKPCLILSFQHNWLGNYPGLRAIGGGHPHIMYIVSTNEIRPQDVMSTSTSGHITFRAGIARWPPVGCIREDGTDETLIEITPGANAEQLAGIARDGQFIANTMEDYTRTKAHVKTLEQEVFVKTAEVTSSYATIWLLQNWVNALFQRNRVAHEKLLKLRLNTMEVLENTVEEIEGDTNLGLPGLQIGVESAEKTAALMHDGIMYMQAQMANRKKGEMSEDDAWILLAQVTKIVGIKRLREFAGMAEQYTVHTPAGDERIVMTPNPSPAELLLNEAQRLAVAGIPTKEFHKELNNFRKGMDEKMSRDINGATEIKNQLITGEVAGNGQQGNGNNR